MNKVFLVVLLFGLAVATATPLTQKKARICHSPTCDMYKKIAQNLVKLVDTQAKGTTDKGKYFWSKVKD